MNLWSLGSSASASWAWGTSLIMGQQIAQEKGLIAWIIWAVCNTLTLALFGWLYKKGYITKEFCEKRFIKIVAIIIQLFCLLVQLNFINNQFNILTGDATISYFITAGIGVLFTLIVFNKGLKTSVRTDVFQWLIAIGAILVIIAIGFISNTGIQEFAQTTSGGIMWGVWSGLVLFAGPIGDVQHWQRAEADKSKKAYYLGAVLFGLYMLLILGMAFFKFSPVMNIILLIAVLCITTSTIDSIAVALHEIGDKTTGTMIALVMCVTYIVFVKIGMIEMWSSFGIIRVAFAISILILPFAYKGKWYITVPVIILTIIAIVTFAILGQVNITSLFGIISGLITLIIVGYVLVVTYIADREKTNANTKSKIGETYTK